jgi:hypothetical protein
VCADPFEYMCAPGSGAHDALKIGLVERRSWSQLKKSGKSVHFCRLEKQNGAASDSQRLQRLRRELSV